MQVQLQTQVERRPRARMRRSEDGIGNSVRQIVARNAKEIVLGSVGCLCVGMPIAMQVAGQDFWPLVVAYGGCLIGIVLGGGRR